MTVIEKAMSMLKVLENAAYSLVFLFLGYTLVYSARNMYLDLFCLSLGLLLLLSSIVINKSAKKSLKKLENIGFD